MERLQSTFEVGAMHIEDFPDAARAIELTGPEAQKLADYAGHMTDLHIALAALKALNSVQDDAKEALWRSAIVHYIKCYAGGNLARHNSLQIKNVVKDPIGQQAHIYFNSLRNSHMVHDQNSYLEVSIFAVINMPHVANKIAKIGIMPRRVPTIDGNMQNLINLVSTSINFTESEIDKLCVHITKNLELLDYGELLAMPQLAFTAPDRTQVDSTRRPIKSPKPKP